MSEFLAAEISKMIAEYTTLGKLHGENFTHVADTLKALIERDKEVDLINSGKISHGRNLFDGIPLRVVNDTLYVLVSDIPEDYLVLFPGEEVVETEGLRLLPYSAYSTVVEEYAANIPMVRSG